jgi:hypothetical protein
LSMNVLGKNGLMHVMVDSSSLITTVTMLGSNSLQITCFAVTTNPYAAVTRTAERSE